MGRLLTDKEGGPRTIRRRGALPLLVAAWLLTVSVHAGMAEAATTLEFKHSQTLSLSSASPAAHPDLTLSIREEAGNEMDIRSLGLSMPKGFLGSPYATLQCSDALAARLSCPPESRVGEVMAIADADTYLDDPSRLDRRGAKIAVHNFPAPGEVFLGTPSKTGTHGKVQIAVYPVLNLLQLTGKVCSPNEDCTDVYSWEFISNALAAQLVIDGYERSEASAESLRRLMTKEALDPDSAFKGPVLDYLSDRGWGVDESKLGVALTMIYGRPIRLADEVTLARDFSMENRVSGVPRRLEAEDVRANMWQFPQRSGGYISYDGYKRECTGVLRSLFDELRRGGLPDSYGDPNGGCYLELARTADGTEIDIKRLDLNLKGRTGNGGRFLYNPSSCGPKEFKVDLESWPGYYFVPIGDPIVRWLRVEVPPKNQSLTSTADITGCPGIPPFSPQIGVELDNDQAGAVPNIKMTISQPPDQAALKSTSIRLPKFGINIAGGNTFTSCDRSLPAEQCGQSSILGSVTAYSPLVPYALGGNLYLRSPDSQGNLGITIHIKGRVGKGDIEVKAEGRIELDAVAGTLTAVVNEGQIPEVPLSRLEMDIRAGLLKNPSKAGVYSAEMSATGHNGASYTSTAAVTIGGTILGDPDAELSVELSNKRAKATTALDAEYELTIPQKLKSFKLGLGSSKKNTLKASTARLKRLSRKRAFRRKGVEIGRITIGRKKESRRARLLAKRGRITAQMQKGTVKSFKRKIKKASGAKRARLKRAYSSYRKDVKRMKVTIMSRYLQIKRLPTKYELKNVNLSLARRGRLLRNPSKKGTVTFVASTDGKNVASDKVKIRQKKKRKARKR